MTKTRALIYVSVAGFSNTTSIAIPLKSLNFFCSLCTVIVCVGIISVAIGVFSLCLLLVFKLFVELQTMANTIYTQQANILL